MTSTCSKLSCIAARGCLVLRCSPGGMIQCSSNRRQFSSSSRRSAEKKYKLVILGGGTGGAAIANKFARKLGREGLAVVEPNERHYYQPMFTLIGSGIKEYHQSHKAEADILPKNCDWIKQHATHIDPDNNLVTVKNGDTLKYDYLLVGVGLHLDYHKINGALDALKNDPRVCSNYHSEFVKKTRKAADNVKEGNAIFTFPNAPIKCAGAPQKICYLIEDLFRKNGVRDKVTVMYNTSLPVIFGIPKYAESLSKIIKERNIQLNTRHNLIEVRPDTSEAVFELLDEPGETVTFKYDMLHIAPPCSASAVLKDTPLVDETGFVTVDPGSMQHVKYPNVFGIGDCTNLPTAKTAAGISAQAGIVGRNLRRVMAGKTGKDLDKSYDGYTSCPLLVGFNKCIMAEFGYNAKPLETFPVNQAKPRWTMAQMKIHFMPQLYWLALVKGMWHGPRLFRKMFHPRSD